MANLVCSERTAPQFLEMLEIEYNLAPLKACDFAIMYKGKVVACVERRSLANFHAEEQESRLQEMVDLRAQLGCKVFVIVEVPVSLIVGRLQGIYRYAYGKLLSMRIEHHIDVVYTQSVEDTCQKLVEYTYYYTSLLHHRPPFVDVKITDEMCAGILCKLTGMSHDVACQVLEERSIKFLITAGYTTLCCTPFREGPNAFWLDESVISILSCVNDHGVRFLSSIPGFSREAAEYILRYRTLLEFLGDPLSERKLTNFGGFSIGENAQVLEDILQYVRPS